jgi:hypothetical protein
MDEEIDVTLVGRVVVGQKVRKGAMRIRDIMLKEFFF